MEPMKPMTPMTPMKPMEPMEPMKPMDFAAPWWPSDLGDPSSTGSQNGLRYAFFPEAHRLLVQHDGTTTTYDSADHRIDGVSQQGGGTTSFQFRSQHGDVPLADLKTVG